MLYVYSCPFILGRTFSENKTAIRHRRLRFLPRSKVVRILVPLLDGLFPRWIDKISGINRKTQNLGIKLLPVPSQKSRGSFSSTSSYTVSPGGVLVQGRTRSSSRNIGLISPDSNRSPNSQSRAGSTMKVGFLRFFSRAGRILLMRAKISLCGLIDLSSCVIRPNHHLIIYIQFFLIISLFIK